MDDLKRLLEDMKLPKSLTDELSEIFSKEFVPYENDMERNLIDAGTMLSKKWEKQGRGSSYSSDDDYNSFPANHRGPLTDTFAGLCFDTCKLANMLHAYSEFLSSHVRERTPEPIKAVLLTDKWSNKDFQKEASIIMGLSQTLHHPPIIKVIMFFENRFIEIYPFK